LDETTIGTIGSENLIVNIQKAIHEDFPKAIRDLAKSSSRSIKETHLPIDTVLHILSGMNIVVLLIDMELQKVALQDTVDRTMLLLKIQSSNTERIETEASTATLTQLSHLNTK
jgi:hypothetical protein